MAKELKQKAKEYAIGMWGKDEAFIDERTDCEQDYLAGAAEKGQELQKQIEKMKKCLRSITYMAKNGLHTKNEPAFARLIAEAEDLCKE